MATKISLSIILLFVFSNVIAQEITINQFGRQVVLKEVEGLKFQYFIRTPQNGTRSAARGSAQRRYDPIGVVAVSSARGAMRSIPTGVAEIPVYSSNILKNAAPSGEIVVEFNSSTTEQEKSNFEVSNNLTLLKIQDFGSKKFYIYEVEPGDGVFSRVSNLQMKSITKDITPLMWRKLEAR